MDFSSFSAPSVSTISICLIPGAKAGEPTGQPSVQLSDNPFEERR
jgi:hypothetical protein